MSTCVRKPLPRPRFRCVRGIVFLWYYIYSPLTPYTRKKITGKIATKGSWMNSKVLAILGDWILRWTCSKILIVCTNFFIPKDELGGIGMAWQGGGMNVAPLQDTSSSTSHSQTMKGIFCSEYLNLTCVPLCEVTYVDG